MYSITITSTFYYNYTVAKSFDLSAFCEGILAPENTLNSPSFDSWLLYNY